MLFFKKKHPVTKCDPEVACTATGFREWIFSSVVQATILDFAFSLAAKHSKNENHQNRFKKIEIVSKFYNSVYSFMVFKPHSSEYASFSLPGI